MKRIFSILMAITMLMCAVGVVPISVQARESKINAYVTHFSADMGRDMYEKVTSLDELKSLISAAFDANDILLKYDESFFEDRFLYFHYIDTDSSSSIYNITSAEESETSIDIEAALERSGWRDDVHSWVVVLEADKSLYDKNITVNFNDVSKYGVKYFNDNIDPYHASAEVVQVPAESMTKSYIVKIDAYEDLPEKYKNYDYKYLNFDKYFLLVLNWTEPQQVRTLGLANVVEGDDSIDIELFRFIPDGEYPDLISPYCAVLEMPKETYDGNFNVSVKGNKYTNTLSEYGRIEGKCSPAGASLSLYDGNSNKIDSTIADEEGNYAFENVTPGTGYMLSVSKYGYLAKRYDDITITAGETLTMNVGTALADYTVIISDAEKFKEFADNVNNGKTYEHYEIILDNDIDLSSICGEDIDGEEVSWTPIGSEEHPFKGAFSGLGHTISGLYIKPGNFNQYIGLFGYAGEKSRITALTVDGSVEVLGLTHLRPPAASKYQYVGAIAGYSTGYISGCHNKAEVYFSGNCGGVGGIAGMIAGENALITNCSNTGNVSAQFDVNGGIVGYVRDHASITSCYSTGYNMVKEAPARIAASVAESDGASAEKCYYLVELEEYGGVTGIYAKTSEQFASGEVAYLLGSPWGQKIGIDEYPVYDGDKVYFVDGKYTNTITPPKKVVTVEPPAVNIESGEVPYGSKITISPTNGNDFEYSINGGQFVNSRLTHNGGNAVITITEDTVLVVRSMIDVVEPDTEYVFPEATYTYTIGGSVVPAEHPYKINSLKIVSESGEEYDTPPADKSFIVDVDITKNSARNSKDYFIVAIYDTDGALISMNYIKANLPAGSDFSCGVNIPKTDKTIGSIKAFVWDTLGGMTPLAESKCIECSALSLME